jgi:hypothetical protein
MCFEKRLLDDIRRVDFSLQTPTDFDSRQQPQVILVRGKQLPQDRAVAGPSLGDHSLDIWSHQATHLAFVDHTVGIVTPRGRNPPRRGEISMFFLS